MRETTIEDYQRRILKVLVHIQNNLDRPFSLEELATIASFSPYHFHRIFRGMVGESVKEHVRRLRLEGAPHCLRFTCHPRTAIAFYTGYATYTSSTPAVPATFGESPTRAPHN